MDMTRLVLVLALLLGAPAAVQGWSSRNTFMLGFAVGPLLGFSLWSMSGYNNFTSQPRYQSYKGKILHVLTISQNTSHVPGDARVAMAAAGAMTTPPSSTPLPPAEFGAQVRARADRDGVVITPAVIDHGYFPLAFNLYQGSIRRLGLENHTLFLCVDREACLTAERHGMPTYLYRELSHHNSGDFNSGVFVEKAMMKHYMIYDILLMGHSVLLTDLDMYWFKSPLDDVKKRCGDCDFVIQNEANVELNIGFMMVRPTKTSLEFYKKVIQRAKTGRAGGAQAMFNQLVHANRHQLNYKVLNIHRYPDGQTYFEKEHRMFPERNPCSDCFLCHNNWIVGTEAKRFRFREHLMWDLDTDAYYSSTTRRYITYENPIPSMYSMNIVAEERRALKDALAIAHALNRTLILPPRFHTSNHNEVPLHGVIIIRDFDLVFENAYRESTFLRHRLVPSAVKDSVCGPILIENEFTRKRPKQFNVTNMAATFTVMPDERSSPEGQGKVNDTVTDRDVIRWLARGQFAECHVIKFHSLYRTFGKFANAEVDKKFRADCGKAFVPGAYRQLELLRRRG